MIEQAHADYRATHPAEFAAAQWVPVREAAASYGIGAAAIRQRIRLGQWPLGHARLRWVEGQPRPQWEVTVP